MPYIQSDTCPHITAKPIVGIFRKIVSYLVIFTLTFSPLAAYSSSPATTIDQEYNSAISRLDEYMRLVTQLRSHIDRSQFDTVVLVEKLDFDAEKIIKYVTEDVYFEQYVGLLRGAQGTLMSRAGNSLDQAVLLASLLNDAAYESRIVRGELSRDQSLKLIQQMKGKSKPPVSGELDKYKAIFTRMAKLANIPDEQVNSFVEYAIEDINIIDTTEYKDAILGRNFIFNELDKADIKLEKLDITDTLIDEAQEYYWVEYRAGESMRWEAIHPAFQERIDGLNTIKTIETLKNEIPENLQHRFRFQVFLEQKTGDKLVTQSLIGPWERPVVNLIGQSLSFRNIPDGFKSEGDINMPAKVANNTNFLIPEFKVNGKNAVKADVFDMNGNIVDGSVAGQPGAALFQTLGDKMEGAIQGNVNIASSRKLKDGEFRTLSAQWLEITLISPAGEEKKIKRYIIDRVGAENREEGSANIEKFKNDEQAIWKLASTQSINLNTGTYPKSYMFHRYLGKILSARPFFVAAVEQKFYPSKPVSIAPNDLTKFKDFPELLLADSLDQLEKVNHKNINYHHEPALLIIKSELSYEDNSLSGRTVTDIASNSLRVLKQDDGRILYAQDENILFGTWATRLEERDAPQTSLDETSNWNTRASFEQVRQKNIPILLLRPVDSAKVSKISAISLDAQQAILRDLSDGYHVIVPEKAVDDQKQIAWWRVNTQTGESLGMINEGLGGETTKYTVLLNLIALKVSILLAIPEYVDCKNKPQANGKMCDESGCLIGAGFNVIIGFTLGKVVGVLGTVLGRGLAGVGTNAGRVAKAAKETLEASEHLAEALQIGVEIGVARGLDIANYTKSIPQLPNCLQPKF